MFLTLFFFFLISFKSSYCTIIARFIHICFDLQKEVKVSFVVIVLFFTFHAQHNNDILEIFVVADRTNFMPPDPGRETISMEIMTTLSDEIAAAF